MMTRMPLLPSEKKGRYMQTNVSSGDFLGADGKCGRQLQEHFPWHQWGPIKPQGTFGGAYQGAVEMY
jgi:hypothetical protein